MIAIQIAAGIVLAVLVLRFWRQSLWLAAGLFALALVGFALLVVTADNATGRALREHLGNLMVVPLIVVGAAAIRWVRDRRVPAVRNGPPP